MMLPKLVKMAEGFKEAKKDVHMTKFNAGKWDAKFAQELGIKALPTFHIYK